MEYLRLAINGRYQEKEYTIIEVMEYAAPFVILCENQEQKEELMGLSLILGSPNPVEIFDDWVDKTFITRHTTGKIMRLPSCVFTTKPFYVSGL